LAVASYRKAIALQPDRPEMHLCLGHALNRAGRYEEAAACYRHALALRSSMVEARVALGDVLVHLGQSEEADTHYHQALFTDPNCAMAHFGLGRLLLSQKKVEVAVIHLGAAAAGKPEDVGYQLALVDVLALQGRLQEAVAKCDGLGRLPVNSVEGLIHLGIGYAALGQWKAAENAWERAIAQDPDRLETYVPIWDALVTRARMEDAGRYYRRNRLAQRNLALARNPPSGTRYLRSFWTRQMGHIAHLDCYAKVGLLGWRSPQRTVLLAPPDRVANGCYLDYWRPYFEVVSDAEQIRELTPRAKCQEDYLTMNSLSDELTGTYLPVAAATVQNQWEAEGRPPVIDLSGADTERGWDCLRTFGVPEGAWFVGLHVREAEFHTFDYNDTFRNADIASYEPALRSIAARGGWVIRLGNPRMKPLPALPNVIDYAHGEARSAWIDVFLCARCRFFIGTQSGMSLVPTTFGVPSVMTNWTSLGTPPWSGRNLFIPKRCWSEKAKRYLTFEEVLQCGLGYAQFSSCFSLQAVRLEDNTAEDITDAVQEMLDRLENTACQSEEDDRLHERFAQVARRHGVILSSPIGRAYLRKYASLLLPE
jgi:putative glycosyltransferase (TIGR04372 family)